MTFGSCEFVSRGLYIKVDKRGGDTEENNDRRRGDDDWAEEGREDRRDGDRRGGDDAPARDCCEGCDCNW